MTKKEDDELLLAGLGTGAAILLGLFTMIPQAQAQASQGTSTSKPCGCNRGK